MNIIQIFIQIERNNLIFRRNDKNPIKFLINKSLEEKSQDGANYSNNAKREWKKQNSQLNSLYDSSYVLGHQVTENINYYLFDNNSNPSSNRDSISVDVLILSKIENIDYSLNTVFKDIKKILNKFKIRILKENNLYLFTYNTLANDLYDDQQRIKVCYGSLKMSVHEKIRLLVMSFIMASCFIYVFLNPLSEITSSILLSISGSIFVFILSECMLKINIFRKIKVEINDLSDSIRQEPKKPYSEGEESKLTTPSIRG
jgi:hypothetical protein